MRKLGYFLYAFVPFILVEIVQIICVFYLTGISAIFGLGPLNELLLDESFSTMIMIIYTLIVICGFGIWYYCCYGGEYIAGVDRQFHPLLVAGVVALVPGAQFLSNYICTFIYIVKPDWWDSYVELMETSGLTETTFLIIVYAVFLGPICEELIFRGVTMRMFGCVFPFWLANICQAILFGAYHMNIVQGIYAFVLGLILGYVCDKGKSIYYSIFLHILFNFWGTIISSLFDEISSTAFTELLILLITAISLAGGFVLFKKGLLARDYINENPS